MANHYPDNLLRDIRNMADRITNLQPPPRQWTPGKINRYREEASEIHRVLKGGSRCLAARLQEKIDRYPGQAALAKTGFEAG